MAASLHAAVAHLLQNQCGSTVLLNSWCGCGAALTKFWEALPSSNYDSATRLLQLPDGTYFLAEPMHGDVVYVREAYDTLTDLALGLTPPDLTVRLRPGMCMCLFMRVCFAER